jgi:glycosidase
MKEFVFGSLSTIEQRVAYMRERRQGVKHHNRLSPRAPRPYDTPMLAATVQLDVPIARVECVVVEPGTPRSGFGAAVFPLHRTDTKWDLLNWSYLETWQTTLPAEPEGTLVRYYIQAYPADGSAPILADDGEMFSYLVGGANAPDWVAGTVMYQIFPDRFYAGDGRTWNPTQSLNDIYGGNLRGIIQKLDYVAEMGFNAIWLNPFFPDDHTHHGYHATDYFNVNPRLGSLEDIQELVAEAHRRGIRLVLDFVANHWSNQHESFQEAIKDPTSRFYEWYHWLDYPHDYETFFGVMALPQVNVNNPEVRQYLLDSARFWLGEVGFDGLRCDYALGPSHDFWTELRAVVKQIKPDAWLFGEVVESPATILSYEGRFDGCLDFPLMQAMRDTFALGRMSLSAFDTFLHQHEHYFPRSYILPTFLDNHDMNRFSWLAGDDKRKLKLAALCQFTLSGPPVVYNGSEVGVRQKLGLWEEDSEGMAECRRPMLWGNTQDAELREFYRRLIMLRREHPVLWHGRRQTIYLDETTKTYAYARFDEDETIFVALNLSEEEREVTAVHNHLTHTFTLPPWGGDVYIVRST